MKFSRKSTKNTIQTCLQLLGESIKMDRTNSTASIKVGTVGSLGKVADFLHAGLLVGGVEAVLAFHALWRLAAWAFSACDPLVETHSDCDHFTLK